MDFIKDKKGQWAHPGKNTLIPDANGRITMDGVNQPVLGIDDQGNQTVMMPGGEYQFPGNDVYEIPLPKAQWLGEIIKRGKGLFTTPPTSLFNPSSITNPTIAGGLTLTPGYQGLYSRTLPASHDLTMPSTSGYRNFKNLSSFNEFRNLSLPEWQNRIKNYQTDKLTIPNESSSGIALSSLDNPIWKAQQDKNGRMTHGQLQNIINSIKKPVDNAILQQTFDEFVIASRTIPEGTIHPTTITSTNPEGDVLIGPELNKEDLVGGKPRIDIDIFKAAVNDKVAKFSHSFTTDQANIGMSSLGYSGKNYHQDKDREGIIENKTILLHSDNYLGNTVATGDHSSVTGRTHFQGHPNVWGHIRYFRNSSNPETFWLLEPQADEMQQYHKIGQQITQLTNDNVIWNRLMNGEEENLAREFFNNMWATGNTPDGPLRLIGVEGGITPNSNFPIVTNIPKDHNWENTKGFLDGIASFPSGKQYKELMGHNHWEPSKFPVNSSDEFITFNSYDEVLQFRQNFINQHVANWGHADDVSKEIYEGHIKDNNIRIKDLTSSITTDPSKVDADQLIRNLQKKVYQKNQQQRLFDESIIYAVNNGYKQLAFPTQETAVKIQGWGKGYMPHKELDQPWTMLEEGDFFKKMSQLTSERGYSSSNDVVVKSGGRPQDMIRRYGDFIFVPDGYKTLPALLKKGQVVHHRYETGTGPMAADLNGFQDRMVKMDIPEGDIESGLYKINSDGTWTSIPNYNVKPDNKISSPDWDVHANKSYYQNFSDIALKYTLNKDWYAREAAGNNLYDNTLNIRNQKHIPLTDGSFNPKGFKPSQNKVLENFDTKNVEKMIYKAFGKDYPYTIEADEHGNQWIMVKFPETWKPNMRLGKLKAGGEVLPKYQDQGEVKVNYDDVEKGIRHIESLNGVLMKNEESSASGLYGQLFDEIDYDGTRDEFIADQKYQKELFNKRYNGQITGVPGLERNGIELYNEYKDQIDNFTLTPTEIAALSNMLGRQGTRNYLGKVLRDGESLEVGVPSAYGPDKPTNKTPDEFFKLFNDSLQKKKVGGEMRNEVIADMLENGAFLPKFKKGAEMNLEGVIGKYIIKKQYDEKHRLPYIQFNSNDGEIRDNRIYYDKDDIEGNDEFNIIDVDSQTIEQDREHARVKSMIKKYEAGNSLSPTEQLYLANLGLLDDQQKSTESTIPTKNPPKMKGEEIRLEDINVRKDLYNKTDNNNKGISLDKQIEFYDAHVNSLYSQYELAPKVKKIYDRLNSLYYNEAKASNMTVLDYIKSLNN